MPPRTPDFWAHDGIVARALSPVARLYNLGRIWHQSRIPMQQAALPIICVGNVTVGGSGKTPVVMAIVRLLRLGGYTPAILSRGYGGRQKQPCRVNPDIHSAGDVGDEPLLLANIANTWVAADRAAGAAAIAADKDYVHNVIVLDDGLQNPSLRKDFSFLVLDNQFGIGNGRLFPAGPLREPLAHGLARSNAAVRVFTPGEKRSAWRPPAEFAGPMFEARMLPDDDAMELRGQMVYAFAGIGRPEKFFTTLRAIGADVVAEQSFADHHPYTADEVMEIVERAAEFGAVPVTTEKDYIRLPREALPMIAPVRVTLQFDDPDTVLAMMRVAIHRRMGKDTRT